MSELPDLDESEIGMLAYWNAVDDGGLSDSDPVRMVQSDYVESYETYDNGLEGLIIYPQANADDLILNFRAKTDGWILIWDTGVTNYTSGPESRGHASLIHGIMDSSPQSELPATLYSRAISHLNSHMHTSGSFSHSEVGYFNYAIPTATTVRLLHESVDTAESLAAVSMPTGYEIYDQELAFYATGDGDGSGFTLEFAGETVDQSGYDRGIASIPADTIDTAEMFFTNNCTIDEGGPVSNLALNHVLYMNDVEV